MNIVLDYKDTWLNNIVMDMVKAKVPCGVITNAE